MDLIFGVIMGLLTGVMIMSNASMRTCIGCRKLLDGERTGQRDDHG